MAEFKNNPPTEQPTLSIVDYDQVNRKGGVYITINLVGSEPQTAVNYDVFFTAARPMEILEIWETHSVASTSGTLNLEILGSGVALDSGNEVIKSDLSTATTANTPQFVRGFQLNSTRILSTGDRLALKDGGTLGSVQNLSVTIYMKYANRGDFF